MIETGFYIASSAYTPTPELGIQKFATREEAEIALANLGNEYYSIIFVPPTGDVIIEQ